jgi:hypothetical protein
MSNIISTDIDESFPVAGQDNDSQGFRDNFSVIKNSLATARAEVTDLEEITAKKNQDNDFNNNEIQRASFIQTTEKVVSQATSTNMSLYWTYGSYQTIIVSANVTLTLTGWPEAGVLGKVRIGVKSDGSGDYDITFVSTIGNDILGAPGLQNPFTVGLEKYVKIFDFWTHDGGDTVYCQFLGEFTPA